MEVVPRVRAANDLIDELALGKDFLVGDGPAEVPLVLLDPAHQVQRHDIRHYRLRRARRRPSRGWGPAGRGALPNNRWAMLPPAWRPPRSALDLGDPRG